MIIQTIYFHTEPESKKPKLNVCAELDDINEGLALGIKALSAMEFAADGVQDEMLASGIELIRKHLEGVAEKVAPVAEQVREEALA